MLLPPAVSLTIHAADRKRRVVELLSTSSESLL